MKKVVITLLVVVSLLIATAVIIPVFYKDSIVAKLKSAANEQLNAKVDFGTFGLSVFADFPNLSLCLNNLNVIGVNEFEGDTLASIKELKVSLDLMSVINGAAINIRSITGDRMLLNLIVLKDGKSNWDISKPAPGAVAGTTSPYKIELKSYKFTHAEIRYDDQSMGMNVLLKEANHAGYGDFTQDLFTFSTQTNVEQLYTTYGGIRYLSGVQATWKADLEIDNKNSRYTFKENELTLNDLAVGFSGYVAMPADDNIETDIKFASKKSSFNTLVSLIPAVYKNDYKNLKSSGSLSFDGFVKGNYNDHAFPAFDIHLSVVQGMFQYPALPTAVKNVAIDLKVNNPDGITDHTTINLKQLHLELGSDPFDARIFISTPVSDANIDATVKGRINLGNIKNMVPLEKGMTLSGMLMADVAVKGRMSSIENKQYENFAGHGIFSITGLNYKSATYPAGLLINNFLLTFNAKNVTLNSFDAKIGNTDLKATGSFDNILAYYFKKELLKGSLSIHSNLVDLNQFMSSSHSAPEGTVPDTAALSVIEIPSNIDFTLHATAANVRYQDLDMQNLQGNVTMKNAVLEMSGITFNTLDGQVNMSGTYSTVKVKQPAFNLSLAVTGFDIAKTTTAFTTLRKMAPIAERCTGKVSSTFAVLGTLDSHMQPVLNSLTGGGTLKTGNVILSNFEPLSQMADALKMPQYKQLALNNINLSFKFKDGRVNIAPFETTLAGTTATIEGSNGFDQTIDYNIDLAIPKSQLGTQANSVMNNLVAGANKSAGTAYSMPDPIHVKVNLGGTVTHPVIKTGWKDAASNLTETIATEVNAVVEEKIDEGKAAAKEQADKLINDAESKAKELHAAAVIAADKAKKEGYAAADKLVTQAKDPISKAVAQAAADQLKKEADAQSAKIIKSADDEGKRLVEEARKQADALLK